jgi:hypothetical protein
LINILTLGTMIFNDPDQHGFTFALICLIMKFIQTRLISIHFPWLEISEIDGLTGREGYLYLCFFQS